MGLIRSVKVLFGGISAFFVVGGACLLFRPDTSAATICILLGIASVIYGVVRLVGYFSDDLYRLAFQFDLAVGILAILIGGILIFRTQSVLANLPLMIGCFLLVDSVLRLQTALDARHFGMRRWWLILAVSICGAFLGVVLLLRPFDSGLLLVRLMGASLMVSGGENLLVCLYTVKVPRRSSADVIEADFSTEEDFSSRS